MPQHVFVTARIQFDALALRSRRGRLIIATLSIIVPIWILIIGLPAWGAVGPAQGWTILHHHMTVTLEPSTHRLAVRDVVTFKKRQADAVDPVVTLNPHLTIQSIRYGSQPLPFSIGLPSTRPAASLQDESASIPNSGTASPHHIVIDLPDGLSAHQETLSLTITYRGTIDDPPRPSPGLRYLRPDRTRGHIGAEGVYLSTETFWYPDVPGSLATYEVHATVPSGWMVVTQGSERSQARTKHAVVSTWRTERPSEGLTLVANRFVREARSWHDIMIVTYLLPDNAHLANLYLDAVSRYLQFYTELLGPYPFPKFAVVENFFPSGIGVPSFTLLGSRVIRRGYVQPYALGHEIVHSWIGNAVFNDLAQGNWVEGLTTYLANYYYDEVHGSEEQAEKHRRRMIIEYNLFAPPTQDYPLTEFRTKEDSRDNAVGYQKAAMVFHMLRREIGDSAFFAGLRALVKTWTGIHVTWDNLRNIFETIGHRDLTWFFAQWVTRAGAPSVRLARAWIDSETTNGPGLHLTITQQPPIYQLRMPIRLILVSGEVVDRLTDSFASADYRMVLPLPDRPVRLMLDPDSDLLRRLERAHIPPMLNLWVTDPDRTIVLPALWEPEDRSAMEPLLHRIEQLSIAMRRGTPDLASTRSFLILGNPRYYDAAEDVLHGCHDRVSLEPTRARIDGHLHQGAETAVLVSCPHPRAPSHVISWFYGFTPAAAAKVARLLFFYGWDSYVVFQDGRAVARKWFDPPQTTTEVFWDDHETTHQTPTSLAH